MGTCRLIARARSSGQVSTNDLWLDGFSDQPCSTLSISAVCTMHQTLRNNLNCVECISRCALQVGRTNRNVPRLDRVPGPWIQGWPGCVIVLMSEIAITQDWTCVAVV